MRSWISLKQSGIEYERSVRHEGKPKYPYRGLGRLSYDGLASFSDAPLRLATNFGILFTVLSPLGIPVVVCVKLATETRVVASWSSTILLNLLVSGVQFFLIGIKGEYIGRILQEVKRRPEFLVDEKVTLN